MKSKRRILEEAVVRTAVVAAHKFDTARAFAVTDAPADVLAQVFDDEAAALRDLSQAVEEYEAALTPVSGADAPWAEGSDTSRYAAKLAWPTQNSTRLAIVAMLASCPPSAAPGYTDRQLEARLNRSHQTVSSARNWLCLAGWVEDSGERRWTNKRPAAVWQLTDVARQALKEGK